MRERDYYPMGAYDDPNAPYNQVEPDLIPADYEVTMYVTMKTSVTADTSYKVYDEDGVSTEYLDDHFNIAREEVKVPDLKWHKFGEDLPEPGSMILERIPWKGNVRGYEYFTRRVGVPFTLDKLYSINDIRKLEWQYINEHDYELNVEDTDIDLF